MILFVIFKKYLWKVKGINRFLGHPNLNGNWIVTGVSNNKDKNVIYNWKGQINIRQNFDQILITMKTENSKSSSISTSGKIEYIEGQGFSVDYQYVNIPNSNAPEELRQHTGCCKILFDETGNTAEGNYFNNNRDRATNGSMKLKREV